MNVASDPEAEFALENLNIISMSFVFCSCVSLRASGRISYFLREGSRGCPRAGSHWKSGHYSCELYGGVYGDQAV